MLEQGGLPALGSVSAKTLQHPLLQGGVLGYALVLCPLLHLTAPTGALIACAFSTLPARNRRILQTDADLTRT
jgi:hypothetical protein